MKSISNGGDEPFATSFNSFKKDRRIMTCLIHARNNNKVLIASDSWDISSINNHTIQKIVVSEKNPCIVSSAGINSSVYNNGVVINVCDFMKAFVHNYNGYNIQECLEELQEKSYKFINDMRLNNDNEKVVQYFIAYYDVDNQAIRSRAFEIVKNYMGTQSIELTNSLNMNLTSFGTYWYYINNGFLKVKNIIFMKRKVAKIIKKYTKFESKLPINERKIGGPMQWAEIDKHGKLTHSHNIVIIN